MNQAGREQRQETTSSFMRGSDPHSAVRMRLATVASELRKAAGTADGARDDFQKLALRFEQNVPGDNQ